MLTRICPICKGNRIVPIFLQLSSGDRVSVAVCPYCNGVGRFENKTTKEEKGDGLEIHN